MVDEWLRANRFTKIGADSYRRYEKHMITMTRFYDPEAGAEEWHSSSYNIEGRGPTPRESLADLTAAIDARISAIREMQANLGSILD
jgi:hypothetical protein